MPTEKSESYGNVTLRFNKLSEMDAPFVSLSQPPRYTVWLSKDIAIRIAKAILKKYEPEALK